MVADFITIVRSARRSRIRCGSLRSLERRKFAYAQQIADDIDAEPWMVEACIRGRRPWFAPSLSLMRLGLVKRARLNGKPCFAITPLGMRIARELHRIVK